MTPCQNHQPGCSGNWTPARSGSLTQFVSSGIVRLTVRSVWVWVCAYACVYTGVRLGLVWLELPTIGEQSLDPAISAAFSSIYREKNTHAFEGKDQARLCVCVCLG